MANKCSYGNFENQYEHYWAFDGKVVKCVNCGLIEANSILTRAEDKKPDAPESNPMPNKSNTVKPKLTFSQYLRK